MTVCCPTCGADIPDFPLDAMVTACSPIQERILRFVARGTRPCADDIADHVYAALEHGGPDSARSSIGAQVCYANQRIKPFGWKMEGLRGGHGYRFERVCA